MTYIICKLRKLHSRQMYSFFRSLCSFDASQDNVLY